MGKIKNLKILKKIIRSLQKQKKKIVFTNGCFDIIHPGHIKVLKEAKKKGNILIVGLNSDSSVRAIKGKQRPILSQKSRAQILEAIEYVDYIIIFNEPTPYGTINALKPDFLVKGGDWKNSEIIGNKLVKKTYRVQLEAGKSTTDIIKKIKNAK